MQGWGSILREKFGYTPLAGAGLGLTGARGGWVMATDPGTDTLRVRGGRLVWPLRITSDNARDNER